MATKKHGTIAKENMHTEDVETPSLDYTNKPRTINDSDVIDNNMLFQQTTVIDKPHIPPTKTQIQSPKPRLPGPKGKIRSRKQTLPGKPKKVDSGLYNDILKDKLSYDNNTLPVTNDKLGTLSLGEVESDKTLKALNTSWLSGDNEEDDDDNYCNIREDLPPSESVSTELIYIPRVRPVEEPISMTDVVSDEKAKLYGDAPPPPDHLG